MLCTLALKKWTPIGHCQKTTSQSSNESKKHKAFLFVFWFIELMSKDLVRTEISWVCLREAASANTQAGSVVVNETTISFLSRTF